MPTETKVQDNAFPLKEINALGYHHVQFRGEKSYNGVAIISKIPIKDVFHHDWCQKGDCRHIAVTLENDLEVHNFYVPAGGDEPDVTRNPKFAHKLEFVREMTSWFPNNRQKEKPIVLVGDLNIAPLPEDVWDHKKLLNVVSHTEIETTLLNECVQSFNWVNLVRKFYPAPQKLYSWWSYRSAYWEKADRGRLLDHIWSTPTIANNLQSCHIAREYRGREKPSDHAPVIVNIK